MITKLGMVLVWVTDKDEARDFYVNTLGCKTVMDGEADGHRMLVVHAPDDQGLPLIFELPEPPIVDADSGEAIKALLAKGAIGPGGFATDDCWATYRELKAKGVEFISEPEDHFYGIDAPFRDPFGNQWRLTQTKPLDLAT